MGFLDDVRSRRAWKLLERNGPAPYGAGSLREAEAFQRALEADLWRKTKVLVAQPAFDANVGLDFAAWTLFRTRDATVEALQAAGLAECRRVADVSRRCVWHRRRRGAADPTLTTPPR